MRRRRSLAGPALMLLLLVLLVVAGVGAGAFWFLTRPASLQVAVSPPDALIRLQGQKATGTLTVSGLKPGSYEYSVTRKGFATLTKRVTLERRQQALEEVTLKALPQQVVIDSEPKGAQVTVSYEGGRVEKGSTPFKKKLPSGQLKIVVFKPGFQKVEKKLFLDEPLSFTELLDPPGQVLDAISIFDSGPAPKGVAITNDGKQVWSSLLGGPPSVEVYDPFTGKKLGGADIGKYGAVEIVFSKDGKRAYASQMETAKVFEIDTKTFKVLRSFDTESSWTKVIELSEDGRTLFAANWSGNDVSEIDLASGQLRRRLPTVKTPRGLYATGDGKYLYVAGFQDGDIEKIDLSTGEGKVIYKTGGAMRHLVADEKRGLMYASDMGKDKVFVVDLKTDKVRKFADTDHKPNTIDLTPDGKVLFISNRGENNPKTYYIPGYEWGTILVYDTTTGKPLDAVIGGNQCTALDVSADGRYLMFSDFLDNRLRFYRIPPYEQLVAGNGGRFEAHFAALKK